MCGFIYFFLRLFRCLVFAFAFAPSAVAVAVAVVSALSVSALVVSAKVLSSRSDAVGAGREEAGGTPSVAVSVAGGADGLQATAAISTERHSTAGIVGFT